MRLGGFVTGVLALAALEVVTSSPGAADRTAQLPLAAAGIAKRLFDPNFALIPNWHDGNAPAHQSSPLIESPATGTAGTAAGGVSFDPKTLRAAHGG